MNTYWPAECLAASDSPFEYEQVCQIAAKCKLPLEEVGTKTFKRSDGVIVHRLFAVGPKHSDRTEAYIAAGALGVHIALNGGRMPGFGMVCVLENFSPVDPSSNK